MNRTLADNGGRVHDARDDDAELEKPRDANSGAIEFDPQVAKRLKLKADFILLPLLTIAYLLK
jgi:hypothetical protein